MQPQQETNITQNTIQTEAPANLNPVQALPTPTDQVPINNFWSKYINLLNYITLAICLGFLFIIDIPILNQRPELASFFYYMVVSTIIFIGCLLFERRASKRLRHVQQTQIDATIFVLAILRNIIFILNVIPFIQLIGMLLSLPNLVFIILIIVSTSTRLKQSRQSQL